MELPLAWSVLLLVASAWNLAVWPSFLIRIARDPRARDADGRPTRFLTVHLVLVGVSMLLGLGVLAVAVLTLL
ncbi:MAG TPA: hypothetical protein VGC67_17680 [Cellulomonas sp.]